jgi:uncharacterized membrane protein (Fun14 family)
MFSNQFFESALVALLALDYPTLVIIRRDHALIFNRSDNPGRGILWASCACRVAPMVNPDPNRTRFATLAGVGCSPISAMNPSAQRILGAVLGAAAAGGDGPWRAKSVLLAFLVVLVGLGLWVRDAVKGPPPPVTQHTTVLTGQSASSAGWDFTRPIPGYARVCASYIGGFFIGWAIRRFVRLALGLVALAALLVGLCKYMGCDAAPAETEVKERAAWVQREAETATGYLKGLLPSTSAGAVGVFLGFRRKGRVIAPAGNQSSAG